MLYLIYGEEPDGLCAVVPCGSATAPVFCEISTSVTGDADPIPMLPVEVIRNLSVLEPPVFRVDSTKREESSAPS